jgi:hypothetical protein
MLPARQKPGFLGEGPGVAATGAETRFLGHRDFRYGWAVGYGGRGVAVE